MLIHKAPISLLWKTPRSSSFVEILTAWTFQNAIYSLNFNTILTQSPKNPYVVTCTIVIMSLFLARFIPKSYNFTSPKNHVDLSSYRNQLRETFHKCSPTFGGEPIYPWFSKHSSFMGIFPWDWSWLKRKIMISYFEFHTIELGHGIPDWTPCGLCDMPTTW